MLLSYIDESYDKRTFLIGAVVVEGRLAQPIVKALDELVIDWVHVCRDPDAELHGQHILNGKGEWARLEDIDERLRLYSQALDALVAHDVKIVVEGVDRPGLERRYPTWPSHTDGYAHEVVATFIFERVNELAGLANDVALVIADEVSNSAPFRRDLAYYRKWGTWGYRSQKIRNVVDTVHFSPSSASRLLQAADLVTHVAYRRQLSGAHPLAREAINRLWEQVASRVYRYRIWEPNPRL